MFTPETPAPPAPDVTPTATLRFHVGWRNVVEGAIRRGGRLLIDYDPERLPECRLNWRGAEAWDVEVEGRFHPGGQTIRASVLDAVRSPPGYGMIVRRVRRLVTVEVPADAERVELWFHNFDQVDGRCQSWDSCFGRNYWFDIAP